MSFYMSKMILFSKRLRCKTNCIVLIKCTLDTTKENIFLGINLTQNFSLPLIIYSKQLNNIKSAS